MTIDAIYRLGIKKLNEAGIENSSLDARILICDTLKITPEKFIIDSARILSPAEIQKINNLIGKRSQNVPVAYLTGHKEFFGLDFIVDKNVLIPRPETEYLVELALDIINKDSKVLDLGTGSGNIIIALAKNTDADLFASDISAKALAVAKQNAKLYNVEKKIKFYQSNLFSNPRLQQEFDIVIANLPYVPKSDIDERSIKFEPEEAIFADFKGTDIIKRFLRQVPKYLKKDGAILIELDPRNAIEIGKTAKNIFPKQKIRLEKDLAGFLRYLTISS